MPTIDFEDSIDIEDIGNVIIDAYNDMAEEWLLKISTKLGFTRVETFGPLVNRESGEYISYTRYAFEYNAKKIGKIIDKFLLDLGRGISQVFLIKLDDYKEKLLKVWQPRL